MSIEKLVEFARHQQYCIDQKIKLDVIVVISEGKIGRVREASVSHALC